MVGSKETAELVEAKDEFADEVVSTDKRFSSGVVELPNMLYEGG